MNLNNRGVDIVAGIGYLECVRGSQEAELAGGTMSSNDDFSRWIAERRGISVEEHLRRLAEERRVRAEIQSENGDDEEGDDEE